MSVDAALEFASKASSLVSVQGIDGYWATKTGGEVSASTTAVWDGGATDPDQLAGPRTTGNVTLTRPYKTGRDQPMLRKYRPLVNSWRTVLTDQPTDADKMPLGDPDTYAGALLVRVAGVDIDAASGDPKMVEIEFAVRRII